MMILLAVLILFVAVILVRTAGFQPKAQPELSTESVEFDREKAVSNLAELIAGYEKQTEIERNHILDFHVRFEEIFPFEDGNGRVGRLIMFKECLRYGVMPFIIDDKRRSRYLHGIREWHEDRYTLTDRVMDAQSRFEAQIELQRLHAAGQFYAPATYKEGFDDEDE